MAKKKIKQETGIHTHEWFPVAIDEECAFAFFECVGCTEVLWRNTSPAYPADVIGEVTE